MPKTVRHRQCPRCGYDNAARDRQCRDCGTWLIKRRFTMNRARVMKIHALARRKGWDEDTYRMRLAAAGVATCKELNRQGYNQIIRELEALPDCLQHQLKHQRSQAA